MPTVLINQRAYTTSPLGAEYCFDLDYLTVISVEGDASLAFLQGQCTANVEQVTPHQAKPALFCDVKGRIIAIVDIIFWKNGYKLILPKDIAPLLLKSLQKVALLSRITLKEETHLQVYGWRLTNLSVIKLPSLPQDIYQGVEDEQGYCYRITADDFIYLTQKTEKPLLCKGSIEWHYYQLLAKRMEIYPQTAGLFLPQRLGLDQNGYVDFNKGCYKGQEIIARMHYRSTAKHGVKVLIAEEKSATEASLNSPFSPGASIFAKSSQQAIGELIDYCIWAESLVILVSILFEHEEEIIIDDRAFHTYSA